MISGSLFDHRELRVVLVRHIRERSETETRPDPREVSLYEFFLTIMCAGNTGYQILPDTTTPWMWVVKFSDTNGKKCI